ncbi:MAG: tetratricopeptide repeat protein, partial [Calditerrivibrio sp.]|nr:tetratricopeptide repeat protein [Calditerrivibrio sp.]
MNEASVKKYLNDVEYFTKKLEEDPKSRLFMPLAFAYLRLGKYDDAIDICSKGLDNHPDYHAAKTILANAFLEKGMIDEARNILYDIIEVSPDNYRANKMLGDILRNDGDFTGAAVYYRSALAISPEDFDLRVLIDELTESSNIKPFDMPSDITNLEEKLNETEKNP